VFSILLVVSNSRGGAGRRSGAERNVSVLQDLQRTGALAGGQDALLRRRRSAQRLRAFLSRSTTLSSRRSGVSFFIRGSCLVSYLLLVADSCAERFAAPLVMRLWLHSYLSQRNVACW